SARKPAELESSSMCGTVSATSSTRSTSSNPRANASNVPTRSISPFNRNRKVRMFTPIAADKPDASRSVPVLTTRRQSRRASFSGVLCAPKLAGPQRNTAHDQSNPQRRDLRNRRPGAAPAAMAPRCRTALSLPARRVAAPNFLRAHTKLLPRATLVNSQQRSFEGSGGWPASHAGTRLSPARDCLVIAQVAPLAESVPPKQYGGTERVVAYLSEALVAAGHEVVLFASGDSSARVKLHACCPRALRGQRDVCDPQLWSALQFQALLDHAASFDVIHFHNGYLHFPLCEHLPPHLTTLHGRLDFDPPQFYGRYPRAPLVSISAAQRKPWPHAAWLRTIHHGLPRGLLHAGPGDG